MPRYIAMPSRELETPILNLAEVRFDKNARMCQMDKVRRVRIARADRSRVPNKTLLEEMRSHIELVLLGMHVIDTDVVDRERLSEALPDHEIVEDEPLALIDPIKSDVREDESELDLWHLDAIGLNAARAAGFDKKGIGVGVAVLDTGITEVPEIQGRVKASYSLNPTRKHSVPPCDTEGHGTHVAGLVAGSRVGVAPGVDLTNVIMLPQGRGMVSDFVNALEFVAESPEISILNMSAGLRGYRPGMRSAVAAVMQTGVLPVIAIGNEERNTSRSPGNYREVLSVGASTMDNKVASFSGGGTMVVDHQSYVIPDLVAPGHRITSCVMDGGYESWSGTSMATPVVSGLAALIIERYPTITSADLQDELLDSALDLHGVPPTRQGEGLAQLPARMVEGRV